MKNLIYYNVLLYFITYEVEKMVKAIIDLGEYEDRIATIVKGKYGLKNKSEAINLVISKFEEEFLEPQLRPEYIEKLKNIEKQGYSKSFTSLDEMKKHIESD